MDPSTTLSLSVTLAVLAAAVTHATWNAIAHGIKDQTLAFALIGAGGIVVAIPLIIVTAMPKADCWPYLMGSVAIHVLYNLLLMRCYRLGEFGQVYPLARGTSPIVVTILAAIFVHERLAGPLIAGGLLVLGRPAPPQPGGLPGRGRHRPDHRRLHHGRRRGRAAVGQPGRLHRLADAAREPLRPDVCPPPAARRPAEAVAADPAGRPGRRGAERPRLRPGAVGADPRCAGPDRRAPRDQRDLRGDHRHAGLPRTVRPDPHRGHRPRGGRHRAAEPGLARSQPGIGKTRGSPVSSRLFRLDKIIGQPWVTMRQNGSSSSRSLCTVRKCVISPIGASSKLTVERCPPFAPGTPDCSQS